MKNRQIHPEIADNAGETRPRRSQALGAGALTLCVVALVGAGCDMRPKPIASRDVCPVPLTPDSTDRRSQQAPAPVIEGGRRDTVWKRPSLRDEPALPVAVARNELFRPEYQVAQLPALDGRAMLGDPSPGADQVIVADGARIRLQSQDERAEEQQSQKTFAAPAFAMACCRAWEKPPPPQEALIATRFRP